MVKLIIGIALVAVLGSAYIFSFRANNKGKPSDACSVCAGKKCSGCAFKEK